MSYLTPQTTALGTKGDLDTYSTETVALPVGTDDFVLMADASEATGLKWGAGTPGPAGTFYNYTLQSGTSYTAIANDFVVASNTGTVTITLPPATTVNDTIIVKKTGSGGTVTVDGDASETIDGALTFVISTQYQSITLISDGTNWLVV